MTKASARHSLPLALGITLAIVAAFLLRPDGLFRRSPQNVVVILVDTLRPDHLGAYGYARNTSPEIDRWAASGTVFTRAYSVSNWTNPTIKAVFTGQSPQAVMREAMHREAIRIPLPNGVATFAELARVAGYRTAALVDHPGISPGLAFDRGFTSYEMLFRNGAVGRGSWGKSDVAYVAKRFGEQLDASAGARFLIYLHVVYPHRPYRAGAPYAGLFGPEDYGGFRAAELPKLINAYDSEIRRTDELVGQVRAALDARGLAENTWTILWSDHGEAFWEHGFAEHGNAFYDEIIKIPLVLIPPRGTTGFRRRVDAPVSNIDVFATVLDIAGVRPPTGAKGVSLVSAGRGAFDPLRVLFSESPHSHDIRARAVIRDGFKYAVYPGRSPAQQFLFNLGADPLEQRELFSVRPQTAKMMQGLLDEHVQKSLRERERLDQRTVEPSAETLDGLRSLGYIR